MGRSAAVLVITLACAVPAVAQTRVSVAGDMFADIKRFSGDPTSTLDGNGIGGGAEMALIVSDRWSMRFGVEVGSTTTRSTTDIFDAFTLLRQNLTALGLTMPAPQRLRLDTATRLIASSVLLGYHVPAAGRVRPAIFGGLTFMHVRRRITVPVAMGNVLSFSDVTNLPFAIANPFPFPSFTTVTRQQIDNVPAATVGAEVALALTSHLAAVPGIRAHAFSLSGGGPSGFVIRPGIAVRWTF